jgi:uroporphyrinogen III methyltransferase/synthase
MSDIPRKAGKVYLVGAGPGDPKLLTIRGKECLQRADVVLYDYLANPALLALAPVEAERIYVGRRGRQAYDDQDHINHLLIQKAGEGKIVVRLKGGDPFVFGRGGEEAEAVAAAGVAYEIVPGVTSAVAVPAYAGIPVTHRTFASSVAFLTAHEDPTKGASALDWSRMASGPGTLVFLMGVKNLQAVVDRLITEGKSPDLPVAVIRWGTRALQRTVVGALRDIVEKVAKAKVEPPALVVVGDVVRLRERLNWFESKPLFGKRILVTRAPDQAPDLSDRLAEQGAEPVECPTIQIAPPESWEPTDRAIGDLRRFRWVVFTSVNGVKYFMERIRHAGKDARAFAGSTICVIGPKTADELATVGLKADLVPSDFQAEGLLDAMLQAGVAAGDHVLIPRAAVARELLPDQLRRMGVNVRVVPVYRTVRPAVDIEPIKDLLRAHAFDFVTFASSSTVINFCDLFDSRDELVALTWETTIACIGPITAQTVRDRGLTVGVTAAQNTIPALVDAIVRHAVKGSTQRA